MEYMKFIFKGLKWGFVAALGYMIITGLFYKVNDIIYADQDFAIAVTDDVSGIYMCDNICGDSNNPAFIYYKDLYNQIVAEVNLPGFSDDQIRELAKSGRICEVFGHSWRDGKPGEGLDGYFANYHPYTNFRTCKICGKREEQDLSWE